VHKINNILFITPPYHAGVVESAGRWMPLSFVYLAGAVRRAGYKAEIYDAMTKQHTLEDIALRLKSTAFDIIAITSITSTLPAAIEVLRLAKNIHPSATTIMGGVHPTFCADEIFDKYGDTVDYIVTGEGEETLPTLLKALDGVSALSEIRGIVYRDGGRTIQTPHQAFVRDLDALSTAWDLLDWNDYRYFVIPDSRLAAISTSRGCTFGCTFCSQQKFWKKIWRGRQPEKIVKEIEMLRKSYGANVFLIADEYPTRDQARWEEILDRIIRQKLDIYLLMETRVEDIVRDRSVLWKYREAGIVHIYVGVEATNQQTLDLVKKEINVEQSKEAIRLIHEHRMISETSFVLGFPWETEETIERTLELAQHYNPDFAHFLAITPWPYADMYSEMEEFVEVRDYSKYNLVEPIIRPSAMTLDQLSRKIVECYGRYYMRKAPEYFSEEDLFKCEYLKRSMHLIMKNSFLTGLLKKFGSNLDFAKTAFHQPAPLASLQEL